MNQSKADVSGLADPAAPVSCNLRIGRNLGLISVTRIRLSASIDCRRLK